MHTLLRLTWIPLLLLGAACGAPYLSSSALAEVECVVPPEGCEARSGDVLVTVDERGQVEPACFEIDPATSRVIWVGKNEAKLRDLRVRFKRTRYRGPDDPTCGGQLCLMSTTAVRLEERAYCYALSLRTESGRTAVVDPKLIIKY